MLKVSAKSPTLLVVAGVVGFGATAVLAAKASRKADPIIENHQKSRQDLANVMYTSKKAERKEIVDLYVHTAVDLGKLYGPTIFVGALSTAAVLSGHNLLQKRYVGAMAAYSSLFDQFSFYRKRVSDSFGEEMERDIYEGAKLEWQEDANHKGEYKLGSEFKTEKDPSTYIQPWFDEANPNWLRDPVSNYLFLKAVQQHCNHRLQAKGHLFLNEVYDALRMDRHPEGQVAGWLWEGDGDNFVDFGFMTSNEPHTVAFRNGVESTVRLNFNIDGVIWDKI